MSENAPRTGYQVSENAPLSRPNDTMMAAPRTTINPVREIIPKVTNLNPRSLVTAAAAYPAKQEVLPATTAAAYPAAPLSTAIVPAAAVQQVNPLQAAAKTAIPSLRGRLLRRGDLHSSTEDAVMMDHVRATHDLDASHYNVKPLVHLIEDIIPRAKAAVPIHVQVRTFHPWFNHN